MSSLKIIFMGTPEFAVASLDVLISNGYNVVAVVTSPDRPAGRGQMLNQSAVKKFALQNGIKILQPDKLKSEDFVNELKLLKADLQIVVAFRMLPEIVWNMPRLGTYNLHASLLPKYRGAAPINWAIINGEEETGVSVFKLKHEIDTGTVLFSEKVIIEKEMNAGELHDKLMTTGAFLLLKAVDTIQHSIDNNEELIFAEQNNSLASHAPKLFRENCKINWNKSVVNIHNLVRGLSPYPAAHTEIITNEKKIALKIFKTSYQEFEHSETNGSLFTDNKNFLKVYCSGGIIEIKELQSEGKKRMEIKDFLRGFNIPENSKLL